MNEKCHYFHPHFLEIELRLVEWMSHLNKLEGRNKKTAEIYGYFLIHKRLNVPTLEKLTHYSAKTISRHIQKLVKKGVIIRDSNVNSHRNEYILNIKEPSRLRTILPHENSIFCENNVPKIRNFFDKLMEKCASLSSDIEKTHLIKRFRDFAFFLS